MTKLRWRCIFAAKIKIQMKLSQFKFNLPQKLIALYPQPNRDEAKLMVLDRRTKTIEHRVFKDLVNYVKDGDVFASYSKTTLGETELESTEVIKSVSADVPDDLFVVPDLSGYTNLG